MTPAIAEKMRKVEALTKSSVAGEAAAARAMLEKMRAKYGTRSTSRPQRNETDWPPGREYTMDELHALNRDFKARLDAFLAGQNARKAARWLEGQGHVVVNDGDIWLCSLTNLERMSDRRIYALALSEGMPIRWES